MEISEIDSNFKARDTRGFENITWYNAKDLPFSIHGLYRKEKGEKFLRMPEEVASATNVGIVELNTHTAGGRIRFKTNSNVILIQVDQDHCNVMDHITALGQLGFDAYMSNNKKYKYIGSFIPNEINNGYTSYVRTNGDLNTYTLNMPLYMSVNEIYIGLRSDAILLEAEPYTYEKPVLFYGSSITQGGCASRPGNSYEAMISRKFDCDFINLGFSGNGRAQKPIVEYLSSLDVSIFVCDYDHNADCAEYLLQTHKPLYLAFRKAHPNTPIIFISKPDFKPDNIDDVKRREIIIKTYEEAKANGDNNVYFIDGEHLYDGDFADDCTVDGAHPNDLGFSRMALKIGNVIEKIL